jgi:hypothetical protein
MANDEWRTPSDLLSFFDGWDDPCLPGRDDGLVREWRDPTYCNPPYSNPKPWVKKAIEESRRGVRVALLLKHDSSTEWWRMLHEVGAYFLAVVGRIHFNDAGPANFPNVLVILPNRLAAERMGKEGK